MNFPPRPRGVMFYSDVRRRLSLTKKHVSWSPPFHKTFFFFTLPVWYILNNVNCWYICRGSDGQLNWSMYFSLCGLFVCLLFCCCIFPLFMFVLYVLCTHCIKFLWYFLVYLKMDRAVGSLYLRIIALYKSYYYHDDYY